MPRSLIFRGTPVGILQIFFNSEHFSLIQNDKKNKNKTQGYKLPGVSSKSLIITLLRRFTPFAPPLSPKYPPFVEFFTIG